MLRPCRLAVAPLILLLLPQPAVAQPAGRLRAEFHVARLFLGGGTYSAKLSTADGFGARAEYLPSWGSGYVGVRLDVTAFPGAEGDHPPVRTAGLDLSLLPRGPQPPGRLLEPYLSVGIGFVAYRPRSGEFPFCDPDEGCMSEGAPQFAKESNWTLRPELGALLWAGRHVGFRGGIRVHFREGRKSNGLAHQGELSFGLAYRW